MPRPRGRLSVRKRLQGDRPTHDIALRTAIRNLVLERAIDAGHNDLYDRPEFAAAAREALATIEAASGETLRR